jgi:16S rRNA (cytosine967-C5)-methyltransferase
VTAPRTGGGARGREAAADGAPSPPPGAALRAQAALCLQAVLVDGRSFKAELAVVLPGIADPRDRALLEAICFAVLRHRRRYEFVLGQWLAHGLRGRDAIVHALLLAGLAQLDALKLSPHAAVGATAEAARVLGRASHVGLVNALLRRAVREPWPTSDEPGIALSHPNWLLAALQQDWPLDWQGIAAANNQPAPLWLAVNPAQGTRGGYLQMLRDDGMDADAPDAPALGLRLDAPAVPERLPGWRAGRAWVQDGAAQLAVEALDAPQDATVLDACAAPGGKCAQLASRLGAGGALLAVDLEPRRLRRVADNLARLGLASPRVVLLAGDATRPGDWLAPGDAFDAILLDAPCSSTGIVRRQPDIKWHRRPDDIVALAATQAALLDALWSRLKPGGRLLYATCSVLLAENAVQVDAFLARHGNAEAVPLDARFGRVSGAGRQRLPGEQGMDGFFYALLRKRGADAVLEPESA